MRVHRDLAQVHFPVQVRAAGKAGLSHEANDLPPADARSLFDLDAVQMQIRARQVHPVIDDHHIAMGQQRRGQPDDPVICCCNRRPGVGGEIEPRMPAWSALIDDPHSSVFRADAGLQGDDERLIPQRSLFRGLAGQANPFPLFGDPPGCLLPAPFHGYAETGDLKIVESDLHLPGNLSVFTAAPFLQSEDQAVISGRNLETDPQDEVGEITVPVRRRKGKPGLRFHADAAPSRAGAHCQHGEITGPRCDGIMHDGKLFPGEVFLPPLNSFVAAVHGRRLRQPTRGDQQHKKT